MRPFRTNPLRPTDRDELRTLHLRDPAGLTSRPQRTALVAAAVNALTDLSVPIGDSDRSLAGFLQEEFDGNTAEIAAFKRSIQRKIEEAAAKGINEQDSIKRAQDVVLSAVFQRWLLQPETNNEEIEKKNKILRGFGISPRAEDGRRSPEQIERAQEVFIRVLNTFVRSGWLKPKAERTAITLAAIRSQDKIVQAEEYAGPSKSERSLYRKRGKLLSEYQNFLRTTKMRASPASLKQFMEILALDLAAGGMSPEKVATTVREYEGLIAGPVRREVSYDTPLPGQEGEGEGEEDLFLSRLEDESAPSPDMTRRMAYWGSIENQLLLDLAAVVDHSTDRDPSSLPQGAYTFYRDLPEGWKEFVTTLFKSVSEPDFNPKKTLSTAKAKLYARENKEKRLQAGKLIPPTVPNEALFTYGYVNQGLFWQGLLTAYQDLPSFSSNPRKNPMARPYVLYPRVTRYGGVNSGTMPVHVPGVPFTQFPNVFLSNPGEEMRSTEARFAGKCKVSGEAYDAGTTIYKHPTFGWCTQAGLDMASSMSEDEIQAMMAAQQRNKHLTEAEQEAWESLGGSITSNGRPLMDRKFVSIKNAKAMIQANGGAMSNPRRNGRTSHGFGY